MDTLRRSFSVPLDDGAREHYQFAAEQPFCRVTVSVVLGTNRQVKRWTHTLAQLGLRATPCDVRGDLHSFTVIGHRDALRMLVAYRSIVRVEYADRHVMGTASKIAPIGAAEQRANAALAAQVNVLR